MSEMIFGIHAIEALLDKAPERIITLYTLKNREDKRLVALVRQVEQLGLPIRLVDKSWLDNQSSQGVHQGIMVEIKAGRDWHENDLPALLEQCTQPFVLILDGITDPHNLGACLRSADAAGVTLVIVPKDRAAPLSAIAKKVACGAAESVPLIRVTNLARTIRMLKEEFNLWIVGTAGEAEQTLYQSSCRLPVALVMGAEGEGMRRLTREHCDELVRLPMSGLVSSLNVSVATGICLFEIRRKMGN